eukprot:TRINITY_DN20830_c0_g4_i1.p1 TRINITY_DN20830_c0_g4~~TRINITY_DN20830_c0_g4_i1.p1  ORF type:complete len:315 (+),score=45.32 TRINITY_DN20830_c0_g4_i1:43-987(+)
MAHHARRARSRSPLRNVHAKPVGALDDWYCSNCGDYNYSRNEKCRSCSAPKAKGALKLSDIGDPVELFLRGHGIDEKIERQFRELPEDLQMQVINQGTLHAVRDPTSVLVRRLASVHAPRQGDWYCANCHDLNFAKNPDCWRCGAARRAGANRIPTPEQFLKGHVLKPEVVEQFMGMEPEHQKAIIIRGSLHGSRDPTSVLISRINSVRTQGSFGKEAKGKGKKLMEDFNTFFNLLLSMFVHWKQTGDWSGGASSWEKGTTSDATNLVNRDAVAEFAWKVFSGGSGYDTDGGGDADSRGSSDYGRGRSGGDRRR